MIAAATAAEAAPSASASATLLCGWVVVRPPHDLHVRPVEAADRRRSGAVHALRGRRRLHARRHRRPVGLAGRGRRRSARRPSRPVRRPSSTSTSSLDIAPVLGSITAPTLVIGAEDDRWVDVSHSQSLAAAIPNAQLEVLPAGHIVIQELAGDVARLLHGHVDGQPMSRADQHEELDPATKARWLAVRPAERGSRRRLRHPHRAARRGRASRLLPSADWSSGPS